MKVYKCLNCGFVFKEPKVVFRPIPAPPYTPILHTNPYYPVYVCPKCGSDAIKEVELPDSQ